MGCFFFFFCLSLDPFVSLCNLFLTLFVFFWFSAAVAASQFPAKCLALSPLCNHLYSLFISLLLSLIVLSLIWVASDSLLMLLTIPFPYIISFFPYLFSFFQQLQQPPCPWPKHGLFPFVCITISIP